MNPEDLAPFRLARLLLLLAVIADAMPAGIDAERLGIYDFLAAHPLLVVADPDDPEGLALRLAGFDDRALGYLSPAQRYVTGQQRLARDVAELVSLGLVGVTASGRIRYHITPSGLALAGRFTALYARSYTRSARIVLRRVRRLSTRRLRANLRAWLTVPAQPPAGRPDPAYLIDLLPPGDETSGGVAPEGER